MREYNFSPLLYVCMNALVASSDVFLKPLAENAAVLKFSLKYPEKYPRLSFWTNKLRA